jgi:thiamine-phosphate pyrophosphorylase
MKPAIESVYAIIDAEATVAPLDTLRAALRAGCSLAQLRAKRLDDRSFVELGIACKRACAEAGVPFVINDRADIACIVGADGLHLGQDDISIDDARRVVGSMQIGVSTHGLQQALAADRAGADLIAFGPIFETQSKEDPDPVVGLELLAEVVRTVSRPVIAIGGISPENSAETLRAGARYVAVISALPRFIEAG